MDIVAKRYAAVLRSMVQKTRVGGAEAGS
jgi:hypothetical protein